MLTFKPLVAVVNFHHLRGPEVEQWFGLAENEKAPLQYDDQWSLLPFLALPDGAHASDEELSYFTLKHTSADGHDSSLFGVSCTRSVSSALLARRSPDITRSAVQKAIVAILPSPVLFAQIRVKLSAVTKSWFAQADFDDNEVISLFWEDLVLTCSSSASEVGRRPQSGSDSMGDYVGLSLRQIIFNWRHDFLVMFKALLLQKRMLFFGFHCEELCLLQFSLVSLIPGLIEQLEDCADSSFFGRASSYNDQNLPNSLQTSSRKDLLAYVGLPLQIFGQGAVFSPYTPLQQLSLLEDPQEGVQSYVAGSTNALLLRRPAGVLYDVLVNLDTMTLDISEDLRPILVLTPADRKFMELLVASVIETWDERNPTRPSTMGYAGSEEWLRLQFEEYLLGFLSCVATYKTDGVGADVPASPARASTLVSISTSPQHRFRNSSPSTIPRIDSNRLPPETVPEDSTPQSQPEKQLEAPPNPTPWTDFLTLYMSSFLTSPAAALFERHTVASRIPIPINVLIPARHPCASPNSSIAYALAQIQSDLSSRLASLQLDQKLARASEQLGRRLGEGRERVGNAVASFWGEIEARRIARELERANADIERENMEGMQRAKQRELAAALGRRISPPVTSTNGHKNSGVVDIQRSMGVTTGSVAGIEGKQRPDRNKLTDNARSSLESTGQRASAYFASWGTWASEKRRGAVVLQEASGDKQAEFTHVNETLHSNHGSRDESLRPETEPGQTCADTTNQRH